MIKIAAHYDIFCAEAQAQEIDSFLWKWNNQIMYYSFLINVVFHILNKITGDHCTAHFLACDWPAWARSLEGLVEMSWDRVWPSSERGGLTKDFHFASPPGPPQTRACGFLSRVTLQTHQTHWPPRPRVCHSSPPRAKMASLACVSGKSERAC